MDPLAMVQDLGLVDADTLEAVDGFNPKKYLVYVNLVCVPQLVPLAYEPFAHPRDVSGPRPPHAQQ